MLTMGISIIENSDLFIGAAWSIEEIHLARFRFKEDNEDFVSDEEFHRKLGDDYSPPCFQLTYEADRQAAKQRILDRRSHKELELASTGIYIRFLFYYNIFTYI